MDLPEPVAGIRWRVGAGDELPVVMAVKVAADRVDDPLSPAPGRDVPAWFSVVVSDRDVVVGELDGEAVAVGVLFRPGGGPVGLRGAVVPQHRGRGIGRALLRHQMTRAASVHPDAPALGLRTVGEGGVTGLARRSGFAPARTFLTMRRDLRVPVAPPALPAGLRAVPLSGDLDERLRVAKNEAFRDHWNAPPDEPEEWRIQFLGPRLERGLSRIAVDASDRIAGFVLVWRFEESAGEAEIPLVGTVREHRRRGVAHALLSSVLVALADTGFVGAELDVDAENGIGAPRVYERVGFVETQRVTIWQRPL